MLRNNRPRYWVGWYDRWHLPLVVLLILLLCWLGYYALLPAQVSLALANPTAPLVSTQPIELVGTAPANALVRVYAGDKLVGETRASGDGTFKIALTDSPRRARAARCS